jgi:hypothetical protein
VAVAAAEEVGAAVAPELVAAALELVAAAEEVGAAVAPELVVVVAAVQRFTG